MSTPAELLPISEEVLAFVARQNQLHEERTGYGATLGLIPLDDLRRIELMALATREACMFHDLYGGEHYVLRPETGTCIDCGKTCLIKEP